MRVFAVTENEGPFRIEALVCCLGDDLLVVLYGGEEHVGAIGMAQPRPSLQDPKRTSSTSSVFTYPGHKEDTLVKEMSEELSKKLKRKVVVVAGMHWDSLERYQIKNIQEICRRLRTEIAREAFKK